MTTIKKWAVRLGVGLVVLLIIGAVAGQSDDPDAQTRAATPAKPVAQPKGDTCEDASGEEIVSLEDHLTGGFKLDLGSAQSLASGQWRYLAAHVTRGSVTIPIVLVRYSADDDYASDMVAVNGSAKDLTDLPHSKAVLSAAGERLLACVKS